MEMNDKHNQDVYINRADLKKLSKSKLIKLLLLKQNAESTPKPSIKQMLKQRDIISVEENHFLQQKDQSQNHERVSKKWCRSMKIT